MMNFLRKFWQWLFRSPSIGTTCRIRGRFDLWITHADGTPGAAWSAENGDTTTGLNNMLDEYFRAAAQTATWYCGLIDNAGYSALSAADTIASHAGWAESTAYTSGVRLTWAPGAASAGSVTNAAAMAFTMNAPTTIVGAFIVSDNTKGGAVGLLFCTAVASPQALLNTDVLNIRFTKSLTPT